MGGPGSGNFYRWEKKDVVEDCIVLSIFTLKHVIEWDICRKGVLSAGRCSMNFTLFRNVLILSYTVRSSDQSITESIRLSRTTPNYGGYRLWMHCPGCQKRVGKLYLAPGCVRYRCRVCADLSYRDRQEHSHGEIGDLINRFKRIEKMLERDRKR